MSKIHQELSGRGGRQPAGGRLSDPRQLEFDVPVPAGPPPPAPEPLAALPPRTNPLRGRRKSPEPDKPGESEFPPPSVPLPPPPPSREELDLLRTQLAAQKAAEEQSRAKLQQAMEESAKQLRTTRDALAKAEAEVGEWKRKTGEQAAMEAQSQTQLEALRKELAAITAARENDRQNLHLAETRCTQLEARLRAAETAQQQSGQYKTALDQAAHEMDDLREQFRHHEQKLKAEQQDKSEVVRVFDDRARQTAARLEEALRTLDAEKQKRAEVSARAEGLERQVAEQKAKSETQMQALRQELASTVAERDAERKQRQAFQKQAEKIDQQVKETTATRDEVSQALEKEKRRAAEESARVAALERRAAEQQAQAETQTQTLRKELVAAAEKLDAERKQRQALQKQAEEAGQRVTEATAARATALERRVAEQVAQAEAQTQALRQEVAAAVAERDAEREQGRELRNQAAELEQRLRTAQAGEESKVLGPLQRELDDLRRENRGLAEQVSALAALQTRNRELEAQSQQVSARLQEAIKAVERERQQRSADSNRFGERERQLSEQLAATRSMEREAAAPAARWPAGIAPGWAATGVVLLLVVVAGLSFSLGRAHRIGPASQELAPVPTATVEQPMASETRQAVTPVPVATAKPVPKLVPWPAVSVKGVQAKSGEQGFVLTFEYGVFSRRTEITEQAKLDLRRLAGQLKPSLESFRLEIEGHTDAAPVSTDGSFADNRELGLRRGKAVMEFLAREGGLPAAAMTATSAGEANPPYPNTTTESRRKNRTVILKITRQESL